MGLVGCHKEEGPHEDSLWLPGYPRRIERFRAMGENPLFGACHVSGRGDGLHGLWELGQFYVENSTLSTQPIFGMS